MGETTLKFNLRLMGFPYHGSAIESKDMINICQFNLKKWIGKNEAFNDVDYDYIIVSEMHHQKYENSVIGYIFDNKDFKNGVVVKTIVKTSKYISDNVYSGIDGDSNRVLIVGQHNKVTNKYLGDS